MPIIATRISSSVPSPFSHGEVNAGRKESVNCKDRKRNRRHGLTIRRRVVQRIFEDMTLLERVCLRWVIDKVCHLPPTWPSGSALGSGARRQLSRPLAPVRAGG